MEEGMPLPRALPWAEILRPVGAEVDFDYLEITLLTASADKSRE